MERLADAMWVLFGRPTATVWKGFDVAADRLDIYADQLSALRWRWWRRRLFREIGSLPEAWDLTEETTPSEPHVPEA